MLQYIALNFTEVISKSAFNLKPLQETVIGNCPHKILQNSKILWVSKSTRIKPECCLHRYFSPDRVCSIFPHSERRYCSGNIFCMEAALQCEVRVIYLDVFYCEQRSSIPACSQTGGNRTPIFVLVAYCK